jgi:hypothetical protein
MKSVETAHQRRKKDQLRIPLSMRITPRVRQQLIDDAAQNGRSITQEAELRLEISLRDEVLLDSALEFYGHGVGDLFRVLGTLMRNAGRQAAWAATGSFEAIDDWLQNPFARNQAIDAAATLLEGLRPKQEDRLYRQPRPATLLGFTPEVVGQNAAVGALLAIKDPDGVNDGLPVEEQNAEREAFGRRFHLSLGPLVEEIPALARRVTSEEQAS